MTILDDITTKKRQHVADRVKQVPLSELESMIASQEKPRGFRQALSQKVLSKQAALIAEVKKASPSKGIIREDFDPVSCAKSYEEAGATCLSVLTDEPYFQGKDEYLTSIHQAVSLPILRKDFMIDTYQIAESRAIGADCILLIVAALSPYQLNELESAAIEYGLDVLVEVHNEEELNHALRMKTTLLGINNRNLHNFTVDVKTSVNLSQQIPPEYTIIAESGIESHQDVQYLHRYGIYGLLVGESLMRQDDVAQATKRLLGS